MTKVRHTLLDALEDFRRRNEVENLEKNWKIDSVKPAAVTLKVSTPANNVYQTGKFVGETT